MRSGACSGSAAGSGVAILVRLTPLSIPTFKTTMPNMSVFELLFALLLVCVLAGVAAVALLAWNLTRRADGQAVAVAELRQRLETGGLTQESQASELRERMAQTQSVVERLGSALVARQSIEDEARSSLKRLESVIAGSSTRGAAGEHILEEVLKHLPPEMLQRNVWVGGKVVELALQLPGGKLLPIDSKWGSSGALEQLAEPGLDAPRRAQLTAQVEREVERRVREVSQYIDPASTSTFALAVIPDAAYDVCRGAIVGAHRRHGEAAVRPDRRGTAPRHAGSDPRQQAAEGADDAPEHVLGGQAGVGSDPLLGPERPGGRERPSRDFHRAPQPGSSRLSSIGRFCPVFHSQSACCAQSLLRDLHR